MKICAIIPVYNEERAIGSLIHLVKEKGLDIFVIDDGSTDRSAHIARDKGATVLSHPHKMGKGASLRDGFHYALEHGYDGVITMDGDGQHDTRDLDGFLALAYEKKGDIIVGNRMTNTAKMPVVRLLTNKFMSLLISLACRQSIPDTQCGYRYIDAQALRAIELATSGFEIETEMLMKAAKKNLKIISSPVRTIYENEESKINPFKDTIRFFRYFFRELWNSKK